MAGIFLQASRIAGGSTIVIATVEASCGSLLHAPVLDAQGLIAQSERDLLFVVGGLMLIVIVPVFVLTFWFAWHYESMTFCGVPRMSGTAGANLAG